MPYATSQGTRIYWDESKGSDPLLLVMGLGYANEMWYRTRPLLSQHYRTIAFDNRGVGKSDVPAGPYSIAQMAADAAAVLDAAAVDRAHVYGISMGGMIAQEFALAYPHRVRSLVLGCTSCVSFRQACLSVVPWRPADEICGRRPISPGNRSCQKPG